MAQWYVKDLSKLTEITVQTLHHYDRIGLLQPSIRLPNGYRVYSEKDLLKLQQIIALKFFGFELAHIKKLLAKEVDMVDHFTSQAELLKQKAKTFSDASNELKKIIADSNDNKSIPWETIIQSIEVYRMTQNLEKTWAGKVFNQDELKNYAKFESETMKLPDQEKNRIHKEWHDMAREVEANLQKDPGSEFGIAIGKRCMNWVNNFYGKENIQLRNAVWEKGFKQGHVEDAALSPKGVEWLDKAISAYYRDRIYKIFDQIDIKSDEAVLKLWNELLFDMCGDDKKEQEEIVRVALSEDKTIPKAKKWLRKIYKMK